MQTSKQQRNKEKTSTNHLRGQVNGAGVHKRHPQRKERSNFHVRLRLRSKVDAKVNLSRMRETSHRLPVEGIQLHYLCLRTDRHRQDLHNGRNRGSGANGHNPAYLPTNLRTHQESQRKRRLYGAGVNVRAVQ